MCNKNVLFLILLLLVINLHFLYCMNTKHPVLTFNLTPRSTSSCSLLSHNHKSSSNYIQEQLTRKSTEYSGIVTLGNPPQEFEMVFDTGSANIIITSTLCSSGGCDHHRKYDQGLSSTSKIVRYLPKYSSDYVSKLGRAEVHINFGTGQIKSYITKDAVCLDDKFCIKDAILLEAYYESFNPFHMVKFDGIIGLGFTHLSVNEEANFIDLLYKQKKISEKKFAFYFNKDDSEHSHINIGGIDDKYFKGEVHYFDVIGRDYWELKLNGIYYADTLLLNCQSIKCSVIVDSGTSMITAPSGVHEALIQLSKVKEDCSNLNFLKDIKYDIGGHLFELGSDFYVMKYKDEIFNKTNCLNALMELNISNEKMVFILGIPFLKKYYTVFNREDSKLGFAEAVHN